MPKTRTSHFKKNISFAYSMMGILEIAKSCAQILSSNAPSKSDPFIGDEQLASVIPVIPTFTASPHTPDDHLHISHQAKLPKAAVTHCFCWARF